MKKIIVGFFKKIFMYLILFGENQVHRYSGFYPEEGDSDD